MHGPELSFDYTAFSDVQGGLAQWESHVQPGTGLEETGSDEEDDEEDVEMTNSDEAVRGNGTETADVEMVDGSDRVCYGMV